MAIDAEKRKALMEQWGVSEEQLSALEQANAEDATKALSEEIEVKEGEGEAVAQEAANQEAQEATAETEAPEYVSRSEFLEAMAPIVDSLNNVSAGLQGLTGEVKALKENRSADIAAAAQKAAETALTPAASLAELIRNSIVGNAAAQVKETDPQAVREGAPKESEAPPKGKAIGIPFVDAMVDGKDWREGFPNANEEE